MKRPRDRGVRVPTDARSLNRVLDVESVTAEVDPEAFLAALLAGAAWAAEEAWNRYSPMVYDLMRRALGPDPDLDDVVQEVFLRLWKRVRTLREATALRSFVFSIAVKVLRWQLRRRAIRRWVGLSDSGVLPEMVQEPADPEAREASRRIQMILERLRPGDRTIFILRQTEELSLPEIARVAALSLSTVKRRLRRAILRVRRLVEADPLLSTYLSREGLDVSAEVDGDG